MKTQVKCKSCGRLFWMKEKAKVQACQTCKNILHMFAQRQNEGRAIRSEALQAVLEMTYTPGPETTLTNPVEALKDRMGDNKE